MLKEACEQIILESSKYNIHNHSLAKKFKLEILDQTKSFPTKISFSKRIIAIAKNKDCRCKQCGVIHGDHTKDFCTSKCYLKFRELNALSDEEFKLINVVRKGEKKFANAQEGYDYHVCAICNAKTGDLATHIKMHNISVKEYKTKHNLKTLKTKKQIESVTGKNNPAYQHGGRYSAWSKNFIHGYDEERHQEAKRKNSEFVKNNPDFNVFMFEYWLKEANGDRELAKQLHSKSQTRDLNWFVKKYGEVEGKKRHREKTEKWIQTLNSKSIEELAEINSKKVNKSFCFFSKAEKELFNTLKKYIPEVTDQLAICRDQTEFKKRFYLYDISYKNKIIEYNGDFWHANPKLYDESFINPYTKETQYEINERDKDKLFIAESNGYEVLTIWENEYQKNKDLVVERCLEFLQKKE